MRKIKAVKLMFVAILVFNAPNLSVGCPTGTTKGKITVQTIPQPDQCINNVVTHVTAITSAFECGPTGLDCGVCNQTSYTVIYTPTGATCTIPG